ncbi:predicted protein [Nematostella vectensis]|uniref:NOTCH1 EGF-like calcium-binding domain-containing protein n=1 Tax=Nematostella vectensis TaxID=45351 RepID=A7RKI5_NEMVE|nr:predicted protein [Nematostella vectensis]|eukprot:XP_001640054.1 predicted protein [Nematostella vectensis]
MDNSCHSRFGQTLLELSKACQEAKELLDEEQRAIRCKIGCPARCTCTQASLKCSALAAPLNRVTVKLCLVAKHYKNLQDVDECNGSSHGCPSSASCVNTHGSYYCTGYGAPWNLVARFSNADALNWMSDDGLWWFDLLSGVGDQLNPTINSDMISPLFWTKSGHKIKVTRSDDPTNTPLLVTTGDCLGGMTMRGLLTSFGNTKRDGSDSWPMDSCRHSCAVTYGGLYNITNGFEQSSCSGRVQSSNAIGFFCHGCTPDVCGDAAVMSIGGVGEECDRADHGIGVTEADFGKFTSEYGMADFGSDSLAKNKAPNRRIGCRSNKLVAEGMTDAKHRNVEVVAESMTDAKHRNAEVVAEGKTDAKHRNGCRRFDGREAPKFRSGCRRSGKHSKESLVRAK